MTRVIIIKKNGMTGIYERKIVNSDTLGTKWDDFFLHTNFCRITMWTHLNNNTGYKPRASYNGDIYTVVANNRAITFDQNFEVDIMERRRYDLVAQFVNWTLSLN